MAGSRTRVGSGSWEQSALLFSSVEGDVLSETSSDLQGLNLKSVNSSPLAVPGSVGTGGVCGKRDGMENSGEWHNNYDTLTQISLLCCYGVCVIWSATKLIFN